MGNIGGNEKSFPSFQIQGNHAITERPLPPNFGAFYQIIVFSLGNVGGSEQLLPSFQVRGNDMVTERLLPPNFGACFL